MNQTHETTIERPKAATPKPMKIVETGYLEKDQVLQLQSLWNQEYPLHLNYTDLVSFERYITGLRDARHYLLIDTDQTIKGWAFDFTREDERWFALMIHADFQWHHYGSKFIELLKTNNTHLCGWVIDHSRDIKGNGQHYMSPLKFYAKHGFKLVPEIRLGFDRISAIRIEWRNSKS
jgi:GNAT superfamily N-acetyltransferase